MSWQNNFFMCHFVQLFFIAELFHRVYEFLRGHNLAVFRTCFLINFSSCELISDTDVTFTSSCQIPVFNSRPFANLQVHVSTTVTALGKNKLSSNHPFMFHHCFPFTLRVTLALQSRQMQACTLHRIAGLPEETNTHTLHSHLHSL